MPRLLIFLLGCALPASGLHGADTDHPVLKGIRPVDDPAQAAARLAVAPGLRADLWAAEPDLENPVSFSFDERGRCFVAETFRRKSSSLDIRPHQPWLLQSLAMRSVGGSARLSSRAPLPIRRRRRTSGSSIAITTAGSTGATSRWRANAFACSKTAAGAVARIIRKSSPRDFNTAVTGIGAGVLARGGEVFLHLSAGPLEAARRRSARRCSAASASTSPTAGTICTG